MDSKQSQNKKNNSGRQEADSKKGSSYSNEAQNRKNGSQQCSDSTDSKNCKG